MEKRISEYLQYLNIPVSKKYVEKCIASHPDYPSVLSVVDSLEQLGIKHQVGRVDEKNIDYLPFPYLLFKDKGVDPKLIKRKRDLSLPHQTEKEQSYIVLQAEPIDTIPNHENNKKYSEEKFFKASFVAWVVAVVGLILISVFPFSPWLNFALIVTAGAGVGLGYLLIAKNIGVTYNSVERFCTSGEQANCDAILNSDGARLFGEVTLSDAAASSVLLLKNIFRLANESRSAEVKAKRFKNDIDVFLYLLKQHKRIDSAPFERELLIGNPEAPVNIIMAASLTCNSCIDGFEKVTKLVSTYPGKVRVSIRLKPSPLFTDKGTLTPSSYLLAYWLKKIAGTADTSDNTEKLLQGWYQVKDLDKFKDQYEVEVGSKILNEVEELKAQYGEWMREAEVQRTPSFFVGGYPLPRQYSIDDLMGLIPALSERFTSDSAGSVLLKSTNEKVT